MRNKIFVTGDTHGGIDIEKLRIDKFKEASSLTKDDYVIIAGDFGFLWNGSDKERKWLKRFDEQSYTTMFVDGNHENFNMLNEYPVENWKGGKIHRINDSVIHLMRGQVFNIHGKKFFTFGGGASIDKYRRTENVSWWKEEMPSVAECEEGLSNLEKHNWEVDYIITHSCRTELLEILCRCSSNAASKFENDTITDYLDVVQKNTIYKHWFFGHFHFDLRIEENNTTVYQRIIEIDKW